MTTTIETITDKQIKQLRVEAASAGDTATQVICDIALEREEPITSATEWEERFGGGGFDGDEERAIRRHGASVGVARAECVRVIAAAEAQS